MKQIHTATLWRPRAWPGDDPAKSTERAVLRGILRTTLIASLLFAPPALAQTPQLAPLDAQSPTWPDDATWNDYKPLPGTDYGDPTVQPTVKKWKVALVLADFPDREYAVTQPAGSTIYGNPTVEAHSVPRAEVPAFYRDFLNKPQALNHQQTLNRYWMENTYGKYGVELTSFGVYRMPFRAYQYFQQQYGAANQCPTPAETPCNKNFRNDIRAAWAAEVGESVISSFDNVFYVAAGQDQSSTWQEFGEMRFLNQDSVSDPFGPKAYDPSLANWGRTRYIPWTAWAASTNIWPNAVITGPPPLNSTEGESSGMATYAHELTHNLGILDNYNNPFNTVPQRAATGPWDMMSRGSFNGPGGTHTRWMIPATQGGSLGSQHNLRNKLKLGFIENKNVLQLNRNGLAQSGLAVADVTARETDPGDGLAGVRIALDGAVGDQATPCDVNTNPLCDGVRRAANGTVTGKYNAFTLEAVQQVGSDSFVPGHGVLISKIKTSENQSCGTFSCFVWIIDANPQDIDKVDFTRPDGSVAKVTIGDPRQLVDATFNAGLNSGSQYEWVDEANRLHFYIVDLRTDERGILHYKVAVRSLDGAGPQTRGVALASAPAEPVGQGEWAACTFPLRNTGAASAVPAGVHPQDASAWLGSDVYRLSATASGEGWTAQLKNALAAVPFGETVRVPVHVARAAGASASGSVTLKAVSESDPTKTATAVCGVTSGVVGGTVPATLSLTLDGPAALGVMTPGYGRDYTTTTDARVTSTAGDATLSVVDPSAVAPGRLVNGSYALATPLQVNARDGVFTSLGASPVTLFSWNGPISNDRVVVGYKQTISANEPLRTGSYGKPLVFTLSTTTP